VNAAYLARAGRKVLVLERRDLVGGAAVSEQVFPGFTYSVFSYVVSLLRPEITRDTELLGVDILTAIRNGAARSPSKRFQDFLQGVVTTATSGGQLKPYFLLKAEQYERENKLAQLQRVETMGLLAETFVTVVVAFPLFLVIIIAIFAIIGGGGTFMIDVLWAIVGLMIPLSQFGFIFFMYTITQEM
jgi:flagellar protein FlaJ